ncbi:GTP 3',8-cyclase [Sporomusa silvacetica DSM 10669]|uniref:GTP 3',8-cyclase n=1 Tax=Sporomusa silvacetica DSM 10669 TaxID=1123289 RepID=A0ABZ3INZ0_9FIRM|nr:radical SAM protein [Sporomusa silvacetica]OZC18049.1 cyclic pyranopterin monophosphate synthase [Sporomusa silvacetica DSM 10669]
MERNKKKIEKIEFQLTTSCNMSCKFCFNGEETTCDKLNPEIACRTIKDLVIYSNANSPYVDLKSVWITGGEPLLEKDTVLKIISTCKSLKITSGLSTNGLLLEQYLDKLVATGLDEVKISLDSIDADLFKKVRGGSLSTVLKNIKLATNTRLKTYIRITVTNENINTINPIIQLLADLNVSTIELKAVLPIGRSDFELMSEHLLLEKAFNDAIKILPQNKMNPVITVMCNYLPRCKGFIVSPNIACVCSHSALYVAANGSIIPCSYFPKESRYNIYRDSILDAWTSSFFENVRNSATTQCKTCENWDSCRNGCPAVLYTHSKLSSSCFDVINENIYPHQAV